MDVSHAYSRRHRAPGLRNYALASYKWSMDYGKPELYLLACKCLITSSGNGLRGVSHQLHPATYISVAGSAVAPMVNRQLADPSEAPGDGM